MKTLFFYTYFMCLATMLFGQDYHPLIRPNVYWDVAYWNSFAFCNIDVTRTEFIDGDSLIEGHLYRLQHVYPFLGTPGPGNTICPPYTIDTIPTRNAVLREDTQAKKVYIYNENYFPHDQLLYDFSVSPGDTVQSQYINQGAPIVVYSVFDTILLNGDVRKIFCFDPYCAMNYIESIGGCKGLAEPIVIGLGFGSTILCIKEEEIPLWGEGECNYQFVAITEYTNPGLQIVPNPASGTLLIELPANYGEMEISLFNIQGKNSVKIIPQPGKGQSEIDVSGIPKGVYFIRVTAGKRFVATGKVVVI
ncbi:MAG: T9SS type A sorting domain-containing protein [Bacteroidales bacterium]|nr:T9SS type A sorting domain-containing protein [Bacteroidales bacterium]